ncbi:MAG TPA: pilin [Patescibacteria group bacterium]
MNLRKILFLGVVILLFTVLKPQSANAVDCASKTSICDLNAVNITPGAPCAADPEHYVYGTSTICFGQTSPCAPSCGIIGNGRCCDPNPKNPPTVVPSKPPGELQPPPCHGKIDPKKGCLSIDTAIGTISTNINDVVMTIFKLILGIAGGVAAVLIIASGYEMMTSQGNPEKVKAARERLTSAIVGLLFIIFSVAILQIIGVDVLQLPGFGR